MRYGDDGGKGLEVNVASTQFCRIVAIPKGDPAERTARISEIRGVALNKSWGRYKLERRTTAYPRFVFKWAGEYFVRRRVV